MIAEKRVVVSSGEEFKIQLINVPNCISALSARVWCVTLTMMIMFSEKNVDQTQMEAVVLIRK